MTPLQAFLFGLVLGGTLIACIFAWARQKVTDRLTADLAHADRANERLRGELAAIKAKAGQIYLSEADAMTLQSMGIGL